jgi:D-alanine-D-alanine ligase
MKADAYSIAVVMGGVCAERQVSKMTGACVASELARRHRVKPVEILADGSWEAPAGFIGEAVAENPSDWFSGDSRDVLQALSRLKEEGIDVVFNALHGPGGEDGSFQGLMRHAGLPFTGPDVIPAAVTMDKRLTKAVLAAAGIRTPRSFTLPPPGAWRGLDWRALLEAERAHVPFPWVLKPICLGSSVGVEMFSDAAAFEERLRSLEAEENQWSDGFLVEELVRGRELTCGVLETVGRARALLPIEIRPRRSAFFDYNAKYTAGASEEICPAPLGAGDTARVQELVLAVHELFGCAPLSRTDLFLEEDGRLSVLEINTLPGMTATSLIPLAAGKEGLALAELFEALVAHALERQERQTAGARGVRKL